MNPSSRDKSSKEQRQQEVVKYHEDQISIRDLALFSYCCHKVRKAREHRQRYHIVHSKDVNLKKGLELEHDDDSSCNAHTSLPDLLVCRYATRLYVAQTILSV